MSDSEKVFPRACAICLSVPQVPKVLPCQHIYCVDCLDKHITTSSRQSTGDDSDDDDERDGKQIMANILS